MGVTAETLSSISVAALVTAMVTNDTKKSAYTLVVGLGVTGMSVVRFLSAQNKNIVVADSRHNPPALDVLQKEYPDITLNLGGFDEAVFMGAERIIVSPGVSLKEPVIEHVIYQGIDVIGDVELFAQRITSPVIAVTGSNGKSTVITLLGEMAKASHVKAVVGGNIGIPALDLIDADADLYILELSSFQLETLKSLTAVSATVLNISPDHMDRYLSIDEYADAKKRIYDHCDFAVINRDDDYVKSMPAEQQKVVGFTLNEPSEGDFGLCEFSGKSWICKGTERLISVDAIKMKGRHNIANALAALALGEAAGFKMQAMLETLQKFTGLSHRTEYIAEIDHVTWVNDSKGTNVGATIAAVNGMEIKNKLTLIAGGIAKDADFAPLKEAIKDKVRHVVLIGQDARLIEQVIQSVVPVLYAKDMQDAVKIAADLSHPGDTVLLSPACASFDMFNGFEHRGEVFAAAVEALR